VGHVATVLTIAVMTRFFLTILSQPYSFSPLCRYVLGLQKRLRFDEVTYAIPDERH